MRFTIAWQATPTNYHPECLMTVDAPSEGAALVTAVLELVRRGHNVQSSRWLTGIQAVTVGEAAAAAGATGTGAVHINRVKEVQVEAPGRVVAG